MEKAAAEDVGHLGLVAVWLLGFGMFSGIAWFGYFRKRLTISPNELATN
jgi:hypothetical protein